MFGWFRNRRRRKLLAQPFPAAWSEVLETNVWQYGSLSDGEQARLRDRLRIFVDEKNWEGCGGLDLTDEVRVTIAGHASLLILELDPESYDHVISVLVYPDDYYAPQKTVTREGFEREDLSNRLGEAWSVGTVIVSWADVLRPRRGSNVVIHEFAHQLDMLNRSVDGTPPLRDGAQIDAWRQVMAAEYKQLAERVERGKRSFLNSYGATDIAEFFAVVTESFFEEPDDLLRAEPALYALFRDYYGQDPAERLTETTP